MAAICGVTPGVGVGVGVGVGEGVNPLYAGSSVLSTGTMTTLVSLSPAWSVRVTVPPAGTSMLSSTICG
ncbi:unannotated protein [freshwater metagenome]|uniref:Unannotated protein n=1 Tax=freshwater metagenome TaxID=449393 RepID=A0A6J7GMG5_9ZZZZ